jgi:hypothetical protein
MVNTWADFYNEVLPDLPGCTTALADNAIKNAAIEFLERSMAWRVETAPITLTAAVPTYTLNNPAGSIVVEIIDALVSGLQITPKSPDQLNVLYQNWRNETGDAAYYYRPTPSTIRVAPTPSVTTVGALVLSMALKPSRAATGIDSELFEQYMEVIAAGAKYRLMIMQKKPWSDPSRAGVQQVVFNNGIAAANLAKGRSRAPIRTKSY